MDKLQATELFFLIEVIATGKGGQTCHRNEGRD